MCAHMHMCVHTILKEDIKETQIQPTLCTVGSASKDGPTPPMESIEGKKYIGTEHVQKSFIIVL